MKRRWYKSTAFLCVVGLLLHGSVAAKEQEKTKELKQLYAQSAVLMDAVSGRVLFEKNGDEKRPMASTTKIMTCILALENGEMDDRVTAGKEAVRQPKVHLGMMEGETFLLRDLLHSLMLESHNDSAVAIAEHIGGSVEGFARMMNAKAKELGCKDTYFITPNGLDAYNEGGTHSTTARDLATIMRYCIQESPKAEEFLHITRTKSYSFQDIEGKRQFSCNNHNAFLDMMEGALSGKTGFTGDAGYCYVGALRNKERTFIVSLLACGWPNNKSYKWADTKKLMQYGLDEYQYVDVFDKEMHFPKLLVKDGIPEDGNLFSEADIEIGYGEDARITSLRLLLGGEEEVKVEYSIPKELKAPVTDGERVGEAVYTLNDETIKKYPLVAKKTVRKKTFLWYLLGIWERYVI